MSVITDSARELEEGSVLDENLLWDETKKQLDLRERLLEQSVQFHRNAKVFSEKMKDATSAFESLSESEVSNTDKGHELIEQHQKVKKGKLCCTKYQNRSEK